jgi:two-component system, chemotaxis family, sensor kinase Cph1
LDETSDSRRKYRSFLFLFLAGLLIYQEMAHRRRAEEEVRDLNADLEMRIADRTAELNERAKDLARSNSELQQFAYVASHDLQEPLRIVASFTQLLAKRYNDKLDDDAREFIHFAVDGAKRLQTLISDLLSYSRVGTHAEPLQLTACDVVLDRVLNSLKLAIQDTGATITRDPLPVVMADEGQLGQLLQNLLTNGMKFRGEKPPEVHVSAAREGAAWKISVRDNGIGIPPEYAGRIWVIFQRLHTKAEYPGTGIGLAICKKITERHGGSIGVEPSPGGGSTFCFTIPVIKSLEVLEERKQNELRIPVAAR